MYRQSAFSMDSDFTIGSASREANVASGTASLGRLPERFPRLAEYMNVLPNGLDSYPKCQSKGSLLRNALDGIEPAALLPSLPEALADYVHARPPNGAWVPAVHSTAMFYAVCDVYYPTEAAMSDWARRRTIAMATGLYRGLMRVTGPQVFLRMVGQLQRLMQRGTDIKVLTPGSHHVVAHLTFPPNLHTHFMLLANSPTFETLAGLAGANEPKCRLTHYSETSATYDVMWK